MSIGTYAAMGKVSSQPLLSWISGEGTGAGSSHHPRSAESNEPSKTLQSSSLTSEYVRTQHSCLGRNSKMGAEHVPTATQPPLKQKKICNPLLPSQEKAWKDPGTFSLAAENQQQGSGLFRAASSTYLMCSPKQKPPWQRLGGHCRMPMLPRQP